MLITETQTEYLNGLLDQIRKNLRSLSWHDRVVGTVVCLSQVAVMDGVATLGLGTPVQIRADRGEGAYELLRAEVAAYLVVERLARTEELAGLTVEQIAGLTRAEASALIDELRARPW